MAIQLIRASAEQLPEIAILAYKIWNVHYPPIVGQAQVDYMLERFYDLDSLKKQQGEGQAFYLIQHEGRHVGFLAISRKGPHDFFIHKFYIDSEEQGKGLGQKVFDQILGLFKDEHPVIQLTVNRQNHKAINFYFKIGFRIREVADFDIGNGYLMNDFVMEWKNPL